MTAKTEKPDPAIEAIVEELSLLSPLAYDQIREEKAKELRVRVGTLDKEVAMVRGNNVEEQASQIVEEIDPWGIPVNGVDLLDEIHDMLIKHVCLPNGAAAALAVWALGSYCFDVWSLYPKVLITSPEKRCGKTTLIEVLEAVTCRALVASNISPSAIFRCIEEWHPTLILDEADTFTKGNDELNGIINAGHRKRNARVIRAEKVGDSFIPKVYSVWGPQVIAGIGDQRGTLHDRSIHIEMERKLPDELVTKVSADLFEKCQVLRRQCIRWAADNIQRLKCHIEIPNYGNDRAQDNWEPIIRIGRLAGGDWEPRLLSAYKLSAAFESDEDAGIMLLRDIQTILASHYDPNIFSSELVERLIAIEDSPWVEWKKGKPLTQNSLARLLKPFKIAAGTVRIGTQTAKGYKSKQFRNTFSRYIPSLIPLIQSVTPSQPALHGAFKENQSVTDDQNVTLSNRLKPTLNGHCYAVTDEKGDNGEGARKRYREYI